jgi:hypothetical protein
LHAKRGSGLPITRGGLRLGGDLGREVRDGRLEAEQILDRLLLDPFDRGVKELKSFSLIFY